MLLAVFACGVAWWLLLAAPPMAGMFVCGPDGYGPAGGTWNAGRLVALTGMWSVMAVAMMLPAGVFSLVLENAREHLLFSHAVATASTNRNLFNHQPARYLFGYLIFLAVISIAAAISQWTMESTGLMREDARIVSPMVAGMLLAAIGAWHIARLLRRQMPCGRAAGDGATSVANGWRHGCSSLGCCLTMASLQFIGGAMNTGLMIGLTLWMLLETVLPWKRHLAAATGLALLTAGGMTIAGALG